MREILRIPSRDRAGLLGGNFSVSADYLSYLRLSSLPNIRGSRDFLSRNKLDGVIRASCSANAAPETPGWINMHFGKYRRVELRSELTLTHAGLAACAKIPVNTANIFCSEESGYTIFLNIAHIRSTITVAVTDAKDTGSDASPYAVHQALLIVLAEDFFSFFFIKFFPSPCSVQN
jgi:hypothetical protein